MKTAAEILSEKGFIVYAHNGEKDIVQNAIITPLLEAMEAYASQRDTEPKVEGEYFRKVYIKSEADLPKEGIEIDFWDKNLQKINRIAYKKEHKDVWLNCIDWYYFPVSEPKEEGKGAEEILEETMYENNFYYVSFPAFIENESTLDVYDICCKAIEKASLPAKVSDEDNNYLNSTDGNFNNSDRKEESIKDINFIKWYSGMEESKIRNAYARYLNESGQIPKK